MNYLSKFKERSPKETIKIIKNFFISLGYDIEVEQN